MLGPKFINNYYWYKIYWGKDRDGKEIAGWSYYNNSKCLIEALEISPDIGKLSEENNENEYLFKIAFSKKYIDEYVTNNIGEPFDYEGNGRFVFSWDEVWIQNFKQGNVESALIYNTERGEVFLLKGIFLKEYTKETHGPKLLGSPIGDEHDGVKQGDRRQKFTKGCIYLHSHLWGLIETPEYYPTDNFLCCCKDIILPESNEPEEFSIKYTEIRGLRINPEDNQIEFIFKSDKTKDAEDSINFNEKASELKKVFLQALAIPDQKQWISLNIIDIDNNIGYVRIEPPFEKTDIADAMLHADVKMKFDIPSGTGLHYKWLEFWDTLINKSPYKTEFERIGFSEYPSFVISYNIIPGDMVVNQEDNKIFIEDVKLDVNAAWWTNEPSLEYQNYPSLNNHLKNLVKEYKEQLEILVKDYANNHFIKAINKIKVKTNAYARLKSIYGAIVLAQWYKTQVAMNPKLPFANIVDSENLSEFAMDKPFNRNYWNRQACQIIDEFNYDPFYAKPNNDQTKSEPSTGLFYANLSGHFIAEK